ncbi:hypothetical protein [Serratia rhizosphaerae]|uniref:Lipoprotein n=1 Tax=Serratia rhizosphaerae TaxID=2597702 RepID=A0ABX6GH08_9GAMM|nr:hypothetical protein [Serratia rhizosphaerae]QHA85533.1 hypothetical protein FO014_00270 [Serratia rhizosphaerae]
MKKLILPLAALVLAGCSSTYTGKMTDPSRKDVTIGNYEIHVITTGNNRYEAFGGESVGFDAIALKKAQISAIEQVSGCKVVDSEYSNTFIRTLQAETKC